MPKRHSNAHVDNKRTVQWIKNRKKNMIHKKQHLNLKTEMLFFMNHSLFFLCFIDLRVLMCLWHIVSFAKTGTVSY